MRKKIYGLTFIDQLHLKKKLQNLRLRNKFNGLNTREENS